MLLQKEQRSLIILIHLALCFTDDSPTSLKNSHNNMQVKIGEWQFRMSRDFIVRSIFLHNSLIKINLLNFII